jgi:hypothetical protein
MRQGYKLVFGYQTVVGVPTCPCNNPGNYMLMEQSTRDALDAQFQCWCGSRAQVRFDSIKELSDFLAKNGVST